MSLFWKIFVSFSIAMAVTLVGAVVVSFRLAERALDDTTLREDRALLIESASHALAEGGEPELKRWLEFEGSRSRQTRLLVIDQSGEELLGRPTPRRFLRMAEQFRLSNDPTPSNFRPRSLMPRLIGRDGHEYYLAFMRPPRTVFGVLDWPSTQIAVSLIAIAAASITALVLARYLSAPIVELQQASRALAAGKLDVRVGAPSSRRSDEVGTLARDFDAMAEQIQALITAKETLLRDVSHELRSPLARIRVALALAERKSGASLQLQRIEEEAERLDELVGQVMLLTRLRSNGDAPKRPMKLRAVIDAIVENARFENPDIELVCTADDEGAILGDSAAITSAIENVVRNALAYSPESGLVQVSLTATGEWFEIEVADAGPGVPDTDLDRIFEPFYRTDGSRDHRHRGEGIGLAITARVLQQHGGSATARNRTQGGLEITLRLPNPAAV